MKENDRQQLSRLIDGNLINMDENIRNAFHELVNISDGEIAEKIASYLGKAELYNDYLESCFNQLMKSLED